MISQAEVIINTLRPGDGVIEHYERVLSHLDTSLHPGNYLVLEVKQKLALLYGNIFPHTINRYKLSIVQTLVIYSFKSNF